MKSVIQNINWGITAKDVLIFNLSLFYFCDKMFWFLIIIKVLKFYSSYNFIPFALFGSVFSYFNLNFLRFNCVIFGVWLFFDDGLFQSIVKSYNYIDFIYSFI